MDRTQMLGLVSCASLFAALGCGRASVEPVVWVDQRTPQALVESVVRAGRMRDIAGLVQCAEPSYRNEYRRTLKAHIGLLVEAEGLRAVAHRRFEAGTAESVARAMPSDLSGVGPLRSNQWPRELTSLWEDHAVIACADNTVRLVDTTGDREKQYIATLRQVGRLWYIEQHSCGYILSPADQAMWAIGFLEELQDGFASLRRAVEGGHLTEDELLEKLPP